MIDINAFKIAMGEVMDKLEAIDLIPKVVHPGECGYSGDTFVGIVFDGDTITYKTETYFSGCGTDSYSFDVKLSELNEPIEYFEKKYADEIEADRLKKLAKKEKIDKITEDEEFKQYQKLQAKFGNK